MKPRLLLLNDYGRPIGGSEIGLHTLRQALDARGWESRMLTSRAGEGPLLADTTCFGTTGPARTLVSAWNPLAARAVRRSIRAFRPDVIHVKDFLSQLSPGVLPALRGTPALMHVAWYKAVCPSGTKMLPDGSRCTVAAGRTCLGNGCVPFRDWAPLMLQQRLLRQWRGAFRLVVANSQATKRRLEEAGYRDVEVIYYGVPPCPMRPPLSGPPTAIFSGRLVPEKGAEVLVRAFAIVTRAIPAARLLIAGDGPRRAAIASLVAELGLGGQIELLGHLPHRELRDASAPAWVQVVPSVWEEPFGIIAAEAIMQGRAAVVTGSGGLAEIVEDGASGFHAPAGDAATLAARLVTLLSSRELAEQMGHAARRRALAEFSEEQYVNRFVALYDRLRHHG